MKRVALSVLLVLAIVPPACTQSDNVASWAVDITRLNAGETTDAHSHHNLYAQLRWLLSDDSFLSLEYGVAALASPATLFSTDPIGDFYPTLDTEHLLRILYSNEF